MAKVSGIAIRPGVSKNRRRYSKPQLAKAAARMQERLADPDAPPIAMFASHGHAHADDTTHIAGRVTKVGLTDEGAIAYEGELADTEAGRTVAKLAKPGKDGGQFLKSVSIRGFWLGDVTKDEEGNDQAPDLEIVGIDLTSCPGVEGASITAESAALGVENLSRMPITESAEEATLMDDETTSEAAAAKPKPETPGAPADSYADPGYLKDKKPRYPVNTKKRALAAWRYINKQSNADQYTGAQLKRIKSKIKAALGRFGVDTAKESLEVTTQRLYAECVEDVCRQPEISEAFASMSIYNGAGDVNVSGRTDDPAELKALTVKIATAALAALQSLDPDNDGDIDGIDGDDDDAAPTLVIKTPENTTNPGGSPANEKEATVPTETNQTGENAPAAGNAPITLTEAQLASLLQHSVAEGVKAAMAAAKGAEAPVAGTTTTTTTTETAPQESAEDKAKRELREQLKAEARQELLEEERQRGVQRKGFVREGVTPESFEFSELSEADKADFFTASLVDRFARMSPAFAMAVADAQV